MFSFPRTTHINFAKLDIQFRLQDQNLAVKGNLHLPLSHGRQKEFPSSFKQSVKRRQCTYRQAESGYGSGWFDTAWVPSFLEFQFPLNIRWNEIICLP